MQPSCKQNCKAYAIHNSALLTLTRSLVCFNNQLMRLAQNLPARSNRPCLVRTFIELAAAVLTPAAPPPPPHTSRKVGEQLLLVARVHGAQPPVPVREVEREVAGGESAGERRVVSVRPCGSWWANPTANIWSGAQWRGCGPVARRPGGQGAGVTARGCAPLGSAAHGCMATKPPAPKAPKRWAGHPSPHLWCMSWCCTVLSCCPLLAAFRPLQASSSSPSTVGMKGAIS